MRVCVNLVYFQAIGSEVALYSVELQTGIEDSQGELLYNVEMCTCPDGYQVTK